MIDAQNNFWHHIVIGLLSLLFLWLLASTEIGISRAIAAISFFLLFLVMIIGPVAKIWPCIIKIPPKEFPWGVRGELGIWFAIWAVIHVLHIFYLSNWAVTDYITGMSAWAFGAFVAVFMAIVLAALSFKKAILFLGADSWKWLQNYFTYVIFWLSAVHIVDRSLLKPNAPSEALHWIYLIMIIIVPLLQTVGFIKHIAEHKNDKKADVQ